MLNEFERRFLEVTQNHLDLIEAIQATGSNLPPEYFGYTVQIGSAAVPLASGVTQSAVITIQADAWFVLQYVQTGVILPNGSTFGDLSQVTDAGNILLQVTDTGAGQELYSQPLGMPGFPAITVTGSPGPGAAGLPYVFPTPRLLPPNTNIKVDMTHSGVLAGVNPNPVAGFIMLNGARVPLGGLQ
jgi:hypothetical protein